MIGNCILRARTNDKGHAMSQNLSNESAAPKIFGNPQAAGPIPAGLHQCSLPSPC
jgi:hypothetical protein